METAMMIPLNTPLGAPTRTSRDKEGRLVLEFEYKPPCECGRSCPSHGLREITVYDAPYANDRRLFKIRYLRRRCKATGRIWCPPLPGVSTRRGMTWGLLAHIAQKGLMVTFAELSGETGVPEGTLRRLLDDLVDELESTYQPRMPRHLSLDGTHPSKQGAHLVALDIDTDEMVHMLPGETAVTTRQLMGELAEPQRLEAVVTDLGGAIIAGIAPYIEMGACHVIDRYHVRRLATKAAAKWMKSKGKRLGRKEKALLEMCEGELSTTQRLVRDGVLADRPEIAPTYWALQRFLRIFDLRAKATAEAEFDAWQQANEEAAIDAFKTLTKTIKKHREAVFAYFDLRLTNGRVESFNRTVKDIDRRGCHYGFKQLRARLLRKKLVWSDDMVQGAMARISEVGWKAPPPRRPAPSPQLPASPARKAETRRGRPRKAATAPYPSLFDLPEMRGTGWDQQGPGPA